MSTLAFSRDVSFAYELLRVLAHARYSGSDIAEVLHAATRITPGSFESWHDAFAALARRAEASAPTITPSSTLSARIAARDRLFAAANYYRTADFFLHGTPADPRIGALWAAQTAAFDAATALLPQPARRHTLRGPAGFDVPVVYYPAAPDAGPKRPLIILGNGFDGAQEEMLHVVGLAALERGYHVLSYEGPGQPSVRRAQGLGFRPDWEAAVTPVVDFALAQPGVDGSRVSLLGYSMGGYHAVRAAAFEHRLAAAIAIDGVWDAGAAFRGFLPAAALAMHEAGERVAFDEAVRALLVDPSTPTATRWVVEHGMWAFKTETPSDFVDALAPHSLEDVDVAGQVRCPVYVGQAAEDMFFAGQPERVAAALGGRATLRKFDVERGGEAHCQVGLATALNADVFMWLDEMLG